MLAAFAGHGSAARMSSVTAAERAATVMKR